MKQWRCECSCGYKSLTRTSRALAGGAAVVHLRKIIGQARIDGQDTKGWIQWVKLEDVPPDVERINPFPWEATEGLVVRSDAPVTPLLGHTA